MNADDLGRVAFEAYCKHVGGMTYDGSEIPGWRDLGPKVSGGWIAAGVAACEEFVSTTVAALGEIEQ